MSSSPPKQPRKRRRIDSQEREACVPPEVLPLVSPNEVSKSSKDPNRGMYPKRKDRLKNKQRLSCPTFSSASKLMKGASTSKAAEEIFEVSDISLDEISIQEEGSSQRKSQEAVNDPSKEPKGRRSLSSKAKKHLSKTKFPVINLANNILKYFKSVSKGNGKNKEEACSSSDDFQKPSTSKAPEIFSTEASTSSKNSKTSKKSVLPEAGAKKSSSEERNQAFFKMSGNCYGLLGETNEVEGDKPNHFEKLPCHLLEMVLCQIPFIDLMRYKTVCSTWNEVISDDAFMFYKKIYYSLKFDRSVGSIHMENICQSYNLTKVEDSFGVIIKFMSEDFCRKPIYNMYDLLSENSKAVEAELVLAERFPEVLKNESKAWCIFATAMMLSETVEDVYGLYKSVYKLKSETTLHDITNAMYCIAAFFLYFRDIHGINHGLHYRVYNAIYWIENRLPSKAADGSQSVQIAKGLPGQQSIHSYCESMKSNLTYEQIRILNHRFEPEQVIKIVALAGTGKTTTLIHLAQLYPQVKFLNIMFNKAVCDDAKKRFPPNVTCRTAHSLAYTIHGNQLRSKLSTKIRPHDIVQHLQFNTGSRLQIHTYAKQVLSTIENFVGSASLEIESEHVPTMHSDSKRSIEAEDRVKIQRDAQQIWQKMIDRDNKQIRITHDTYLKLYQLSMPKFTAYQCIMVDEAQDCNPAMLYIVMIQKMPVIVVGDPNQQIYGFRGARNAIQSITATHTYYLTKSFRFGPEIAYIASCCLEVLKWNTTQTLVGSKKPSYVNGNLEGQYAIIARSNVQLFNEAIRLCCLKRFRMNEPTNIQGAFAGGLKGYGFDQMLDIYKLSSHSSGPAPDVSDKFIAKFKSYRDLCNYAKSVDDSELLSKIDLVNQHTMNLPDFIKTIKEKCSHPMELANVIFTTAHKAKGLEFDTVCLTDDYVLLHGAESRRRRPMDFEESNVLYVALTRAKRSLLMPDKLLRVLLLAQEKFEYPKLSSQILEDHTEIECVNCIDTFEPHTVMVLVRRQIVLANGRTIPGGPLCVKCATEPTVRPRVTVEPVIMYLDPTADYAHRSMSALVGSLPNDPPINRESFGAFNEMDVVYVINLHM